MQPVNHIEPNEEAALRKVFEGMLKREPWCFNNANDFRRTTEHGYEYRDVQMAWHSLKCGYLAGLSYKGNK